MVERYSYYACRTFVLSVVLAGIAACGGTMRAPVSEQSERQQINPPIIVDSSTGDASRRTQTSRPTIVSSTVGAGNRTGVSSRSAVVSPPVSGIHQVRRGDTLFSIAYQYDLDFRDLARINNLRPPYTIFVDQELNIDVNATAGESLVSTNIGTAVTDSAVARTQPGVSRQTGVNRQPIGSVVTRNLQWQWPLQGRILRGFGSGIKGIDIAGREGEPVQAAAPGDVVYAGRGIQGTGNLIILRHNERYLSAYAHNSRMLVNEGEHVEAGQQIGEVGETLEGESLLHFEIREEGRSIDPVGILPRR